MSTAAFSGRSQKRLRPGKGEREDQQAQREVGRTMGSSNQADTARNTSTIRPGSRNAATSDVTDCGAL
jgi:hypothetical protein